jgi:hypothetical protein
MDQAKLDAMFDVTDRLQALAAEALPLLGLNAGDSISIGDPQTRGRQWTLELKVKRTGDDARRMLEWDQLAGVDR